MGKVRGIQWALKGVGSGVKPLGGGKSRPMVLMLSTKGGIPTVYHPIVQINLRQSQIVKREGKQ